MSALHEIWVFACVWLECSTSCGSDIQGLCPICNVRGPSTMFDRELEMEKTACVAHDMCKHGRMFFHESARG